MLFADFSPPSSPTLAQQRDALQKGLGRAMQWALAGRLDDGPLLEACLQDLSYNGRLEDSWIERLWQMIQAVDAVDRFRVPILHALYDLSDDRSAGQLCEVGFYYAEAGDDTFRSRLYEIVEQNLTADGFLLGDTQIVQLDGEKGFLFVARARGKTLADREWEWDDDFLVECAIERIGEERVSELLAGTSDGAISAYREGWHRYKQAEAKRQEAPSVPDKTRAITASDILSAAESNDDRFDFSRRRWWGMFADEADLETILLSLWTTREPTAIAKLLQVFSRRGVSRFDARLIELCQHDDDEVRRLAIFALEKLEHPAIREFALAELSRGMQRGSVVGLFAKNYQRGDEQRILEAITFPKEDWKLHSLLDDVIQVLESNPDADCSQLGVLAYASTPCGDCRFKAARLLQRQRVAPEWLTEECRFDSSERSRELVAEVTEPPRAESE